MSNKKPTISPYATLQELLVATKFAVEATGFERHMLWRDHHERISWEGNPAGYGVQLGLIGDMPVMLSATFQAIEGHVVLFYHPTSQLVDHRMIDAWLNENVLAKWDKGTRIAQTDAMNFSHCLHALAELNAPAEPAAPQEAAAQ
jgi:hypothetical protein